MNTRINNKKTAVAVVLAGGALLQTAEAAIQVELNGQPLNTSVSPVKIRNRTVVPMRDIFEALGATVMWNPQTQAITAQKDNNVVDLAINNRRAAINGRAVLLDQPATLWRGRTMVPLRFVSEAMGADVKWNDALQMVSINTSAAVAVNPGQTTNNTQPVNTNTGGSQVAGVRYISIPTSAVVPVTLDQSLSSATTRVGETFTATVISQRLGDSEFPAGTKLEGRVIEARPRQGDNPGVLDLEFRSALLPDNTRIPLRGDLISLDADSVNNTNGRVVAKTRSGQSNSDRLKIVGIGAGLGFVLGKVLDTNSTVSTVLGAAGGFLYSRTRDRSKAAEASLPQNTRLGVRLDQGVSYADTTGYAPERENFLRTSFSQSALDFPDARTATVPAYQNPVNQPAYPANNQPVYQPNTQPVYQPNNQPVYQPNTQPAYQPGYQPQVNQPNYPTYAGTLPPPAAGTQPVYQTGNQGAVALGNPNQPVYPGNTVPQPGYAQQPAYPATAYPEPGTQVAGYRTIRIPSDVVVPVTMDQDINSANARVGQMFTATVTSARIGDSEFPAGTKIEGMILEARARQGDQPGVLDFDFRNAVLPDGTRVPLNAQLISLDDKDIAQTNGRIVARGASGKGSGDRLKVIGIGAGVGFVLGKVLDKNTTLTTILGAAGGYLLGRSRDAKASEAMVPRGTRLGVRLTNPVTYTDHNGYADYRMQYLRS